MLIKVMHSLNNDGFMKTFSKVIRYMQFKLNQSRFQQVLARGSVEDRFTWIYKTNYWQSDESVSGVGSTLEYTENLRKELPLLISKYSISRVFDAPCGDFNWMRHLLPVINVNYIGGDIVRPLIDEHNQKYKTSTITFIKYRFN